MPSPGGTIIRALGCNLPEQPCVLAKKLTRPEIGAECDTVSFLGPRGGTRPEGYRNVSGPPGRRDWRQGLRKGTRMTPRRGFLGHWTPRDVSTDTSSSVHHLWPSQLLWETLKSSSLSNPGKLDKLPNVTQLGAEEPPLNPGASE